MRFLVDEDVPMDVDRALRQHGFGSVRVAEALGFQTDDVDVWDYACREGLIPISCNRQDFLALAGSCPETGLIVLNRRRTRQSECSHLLRAIEMAGTEGLHGNINFA